MSDKLFVRVTVIKFVDSLHGSAYPQRVEDFAEEDREIDFDVHCETLAMSVLGHLSDELKRIQEEYDANSGDDEEVIDGELDDDWQVGDDND